MVIWFIIVLWIIISIIGIVTLYSDDYPIIIPVLYHDIPIKKIINDIDVIVHYTPLSFYIPYVLQPALYPYKTLYPIIIPC